MPSFMWPCGGSPKLKCEALSPPPSSDRAPLLPGIQAHGWYPSFCHCVNNVSWASAQ
jgi:hypothetical protein